MESRKAESYKAGLKPGEWLPDSIRLKLLGSYSPPRFRIGGFVSCEIRGRVKVTSARSSPFGELPLEDRRIIITDELARMIRKESSVAVMHWLGVTKKWVTWRRGDLGVERRNPGTLRLKKEWAPLTVAHDDNPYFRNPEMPAGIHEAGRRMREERARKGLPAKTPRYCESRRTGKKKRRPPVEGRLLKKIEVQGEHWIWKGAGTTNSLTAIVNDEGRTERPHRVAWKIFKGDLEPFEKLFRACDHPLCIRPDHFEVRPYQTGGKER
ncbi:MAG: hypothetical protein V3T83_22330 [Acidobacteriota bacterium]